MKKIIFLLVLISFIGCTSLKSNLVSYQENVEYNDAIKIKFSKKLEKNSLNEKTVQLLYNNRKNKMEGHVIYILVDSQLQFIPAHSLLPATEYELVVSPRVRYENGKDINEEISYKITTRAAHNWEKKGPPKRKEIYLLKGSQAEEPIFEAVEEEENSNFFIDVDNDEDDE